MVQTIFDLHKGQGGLNVKKFSSIISIVRNINLGEHGNWLRIGLLSSPSDMLENMH